MNKAKTKPKRARNGVGCDAVVVLRAESAEALIAEWQKHARGCVKASRRMDREKREEDRYRWYRVAETFRFCAKELRRQVVAAKKRQPQHNNVLASTGLMNTRKPQSGA